LLSLAGWGIYKITKPHHNVAAEDASANITAEKLYSEFRDSEDQANKKWIGRVIEITGSITTISESGNYISINLRATGEGGINCSMMKKDLDPDKKLNKGDSISIKGKCTGFLMDVNMVDCVIVK